MSLRKFASLAIFFGWYLMIPSTDPKTPLSRWTRAAFYKTAGECKAKRYDNISQAFKTQKKSQASKIGETDAVLKARNSKCVPSDALK